MTARAILAAGLVSMNIFEPSSQSFIGFGDYLDADKFEIKPGFEEKVSESRSHLDFGQARASVILPKPTEITIELSASNAAAMGLQFQGLVKDLTQTSGEIKDKEFTIQALKAWIPIGFRNIAGDGFSITNQTDSKEFVLGTDYEVNWLRGEFRFMKGVSPDDVVIMNGTYIAISGKKILGGRISQVRCQLRFDGQNMADRSPLEVDVHEAVLGSDNGFDFLASNFSAVSLKGKIITPSGKTEGYEIRMPYATA